ncbi:MAG: hypothetical protein HC858_11880 [Brachymonas sp.]|nr:hypothetical protein [Brachymonas sp.]
MALPALMLSGAIALGACGDSSSLSAATNPIQQPPPPIPAVPSGIQVAYGAKNLEWSWSPNEFATFYRLLEDVDGAGPLPSVLVGTASTAPLNYAIPQFLLTRLDARYTLQACNITGCSASSASVQPNMERAVGYFKASNPGANDIFGNAIALSADGMTLAVSAYGEASAGGAGAADDSAPSAGAVYVYSRSSGAWAQQAMLKATNAATHHFYGKTLALSADGNTLAIGADGEGSNHTGTFAIMPAGNALAPDSGAVYVYTRAGSAWTQQASRPTVWAAASATSSKASW